MKKLKIVKDQSVGECPKCGDSPYMKFVVEGNQYVEYCFNGCHVVGDE